MVAFRLPPVVISFWRRYERLMSMGALALGFLFDIYLAKSPASVADNILLVFYLLLTGAIIIVFNARSKTFAVGEQNPTERLLLILALQFCFGGLASNLLILYGKSGTLGGSGFFVMLLAAFALGNEFLKTKYAQLQFNIAIYYVLLLTYCTIAIPTFFLHAIGLQEFFICGAVSLVYTALYLWLLFFAAYRLRSRRQMVEVSAIVVIVFGLFSGLYLLNFIPPVPLSVKAIGIYHQITPDDGNYTAIYEAPEWWAFWRDTSATYNYTAGESAFCFSAVYAPGKLSTPITHRWEKYDEDTGAWDTISDVTFPINGGRADGYRGYSEKVAITPGRWRCDVETARGQLVGRISFTTVATSTPTLSLTHL